MCDDHADNLPLSLYMVVESTTSPKKILSLFTRAGWNWRFCAWDEYEIEFENVAELIITSSKPILVSGGLANKTSAMDTIEMILDGGSIQFEYELYNQRNEIVRSRNS